MGVEIERKFLVKDSWRPQGVGVYVKQGYISDSGGLVVRVRIQPKGSFLTVKGKNEGITRAEFEYRIPDEDADELLKFSLYPPVEKVRFYEKAGRHTWEIDRFSGANDGLTVAEIELSSEDEEFERPEWLGDEVSDDPRYYNSNLAKNPYNKWK